MGGQVYWEGTYIGRARILELTAADKEVRKTREDDSDSFAARYKLYNKNLLTIPAISWHNLSV